jgi:hypothetical protein
MVQKEYLRFFLICTLQTKLKSTIMKFLKLTAFVLSLIILFSCKKATTDTFTDKLTFGTSYNYTDFKLNGEGSTFSIAPGNVAFRLESSEDFNSNSVKFVIKKDGINYSTDIMSGNTGHILLTMKTYNLRGSYSVTGYIVKTGGDKTVASASFQMN